MSRPDPERDHKCDDGWDRYRSARHQAAERLVLQPPADQPIDDGSGQRGKNY